MTDVRIITESLGGSPLSQLMQRGEAPSPWMPRRPQTAAEWRERATQRVAEGGWTERWNRLAPAFAASGPAADRLERVKRDGGVVVTTGQQPGLFGGPIYTWSKAMGALALADAIERETGVATAAIFWAATDDADFVEASFTVLAHTGGAEVLRSVNAPPAGTPMSLAALGDLAPLLAKLHAAAGSAADPRPLAAIARAYGDPACTVGDAYVSLLRELLTPLGVAVLDASHPAVRAESDATLRAALRNAAAIGSALDLRRRELLAAGHTPQVADVAGLSLVSVREGSIKRRISVKEAASMADDASAWLSPNVLLRPVVERAILPTLAYLGGPGELAYFAQVSAVAGAPGMSEPLALPRWSCTLVEPHIAKLLDELGVGIDAVTRPDELESSVARKAMSEESSRALAALRATIAALPEALAPESNPLGLSAAVQGAMQSLQHRVDRLERRLVAGVKRREHRLLRDVATVRAALAPLGTRQERALTLIPAMSRHGIDILREMRAAAAAHADALVNPAAVASMHTPPAVPART